jgi:uncharacterized protein (TIGR02594 family)
MAVTFDQLMDKVDEEIERAKVRRKQDPSEESKATLVRLLDLKEKIYVLKEKQQTEAFKAIREILAAETKELDYSPYADALKQIAGLIESASRPEGQEHKVEAKPVSKELFGDILEEILALRNYQEPADQADMDIPAPSRVQPSSEQERLVAAIHAMSLKYAVREGLLGAVAWIESSCKNIRSKVSSATGPFQFLEGTWRIMVQQFGGRTGIREADITNVEAQAEMAAIAFHQHSQVLRGITNIGDEALYLCHFLGPAAARACLQEDRHRPMTDVLRSFYAEKPQGTKFVDRILAANPQMKKNGRELATAEMLEFYQAKLMHGEAKYRELARSDVIHTTSEAPAAAQGSDFPWLIPARAEMEKGVAEKPGNEHNPDILKYIATTSIASDPKYLKDETAWCSAFVNWCLKQVGIRGTNSAKARDWHDSGWGRKLDKPLPGCIVVLWRESPDHPDRLGHVGFFDSEEGDRIFLLGGNQKGEATKTDTINIKSYPRKRLLSFRMPNPE